MAGYSSANGYSFNKWDDINQGSLIRVCRSSTAKYSSYDGVYSNSYIVINNRRVRIELYVFVGYDGYSVTLYSSGGLSTIGKNKLIFVGVEH